MPQSPEQARQQQQNDALVRCIVSRTLFLWREAVMSTNVKIRRRASERVLAALGVLLVSISLSSVKSWAEEYPSHTIKMVVPFEAGGGTDLLARIIGEKLSE